MRPQNDYSETAPNWRIVFALIPYLLEFKGRVVIAMAFLIGAKLANVAVPVVLKYIVDDLDVEKSEIITVPLLLLFTYGLLRFGTVFLGEMRDAVFARVTERAMRRVGLRVFQHLHNLDLNFHLSRKTGGLSRDIERGTSGISFLLRFLLFNIFPTLLEIAMVAVILLAQFSAVFALGIVLSVLLYIGFSVWVTEWRTKFVRETNEQDNRSNTRAIDSLLNYETVKYFNNESYEEKLYDKNLEAWEKSRLKNRLSLTVLNSGQALIIAGSMTAMMVMAASRVADESITLGEFVMVNAFMIQLFIPLNFLGFVYREIRQSLINIERMFGLLSEKAAIVDSAEAKELNVSNPSIHFDNVSFSYQANRQILNGVSFDVPAGKKVAIVGGSGAGKSTIARLLFRFYDVDSGSVKIDNHDIRDVTQQSLRRAIGVVPQDTVLFNDTIFYNIAYGCPSADESQVKNAAKMANLEEFIETLPQRYETMVGERGLKVSGGEKQRIAIARTLLKSPSILLFDEATSALDSQTEKTILSTINSAFKGRTALVIAHRLSTIMDADKIIVMDHGHIIEQGEHIQLLAQNGKYAELWRHQQEEEEAQNRIESQST